VCENGKKKDATLPWASGRSHQVAVDCAVVAAVGAAVVAAVVAPAALCPPFTDAPPSMLALVSIRQHTPAYLSIRQHTSAHVSIREHTIEHTRAYVSIRQHTSAVVSITTRSRLEGLVGLAYIASVGLVGLAYIASVGLAYERAHPLTPLCICLRSAIPPCKKKQNTRLDMLQCMNTRLHARMYQYTHTRAHTHTHTRANAERETETETDRQTDRQTDRRAYASIFCIRVCTYYRTSV
jgi:hypothetical protein